MAYDVGSLAAYTKDNTDILIASAIFKGKTQSLIQSEGNVMVGIKSAERITDMSTNTIFQVGGTCGFNASGTTSFSQRTLTVGKIKVHEKLCPKDLEAKYLQSKLPKGSQYESITFEEKYTSLKSENIAKQNEIAIWMGDTDSVDVNLNKFNGLKKLIDAGSPIASNVSAYTDGAVVTTSITTTNVKKAVNSVWRALPAAIQGHDDIRIFCGWDTFNTFIAAYTDLNLFHFAPTGSELKRDAGEVVVPGTSYRLTAVHGLDSTNRMFGIRMSNIFLGTDLLNEEEKFEIFFAKEADEVRFMAEWKMGVQVGFTNEITQFTL